MLWHSGMRSFKGIISEIGGRWNTFLTKCRMHMKIRKLLSKILMKALQKYICICCFLRLKDFDKRFNFDASKNPKNLMDLKGILPGLPISHLNDLLMTAPCT